MCDQVHGYSFCPGYYCCIECTVTHTHTHTHTEKEHTHTNSKPCNHEISVTVVLYTKVIQLTLMSCHCSVEVSTGCTGAAGPFLSGGTYTGGLYSRVATLVCLGFAFLVFSVFLGKHSPTSSSGTQTAQFVCRCIVISEAQWVVPVPDTFCSWKSLLSNTRVVNLFFVKTLRCQCFSLQLFVC